MRLLFTIILFKCCGLALRQSFPFKRILVDFECLFDQTTVEERISLKALQKLRPIRPPIRALGEVISSETQPWDLEESIPVHKWRTFNMNKKYREILMELGPERPADSVLLLRLLFEEHSIGCKESGGRANPRGTRPLTASEIIENWEDPGPVRDRCIAKWCKDFDVQRSNASAVEEMLTTIDKCVYDITRNFVRDDFATYMESLCLHTEVNESLRKLALGNSNGNDNNSMVVLLRCSSPLAQDDLLKSVLRLLSSSLDIDVSNITVVDIDDIDRLDKAPLSLVVVKSMSDVDSIVRRSREISSSTNKDVAYLSAYFKPLVLLSGGNGNGLAYYLCDWARRHTSFIERAKAKANPNIGFLTTADLVNAMQPSACAKIATSSGDKPRFGPTEFFLGSVEPPWPSTKIPSSFLEASVSDDESAMEDGVI